MASRDACEKMAADVGRAVNAKTVLVTVRDQSRIFSFERFNQMLKLKFCRCFKQKRNDMFAGIVSSLFKA